MTANLADKILELLASVTEADEVFTNLDLPLYEQQVLDSQFDAYDETKRAGTGIRRQSFAGGI